MENEKLPRGANLKVGDTVWVFDMNRRVYEGNGLSARIIYREHFRPLQIVGETSRSWVLRNERKVSKKSLDGLYLSEYEIDLACWEHDYFPVIYRELQYAKHHTYEKLTAIAKILGLDLPEVKE